MVFMSAPEPYKRNKLFIAGAILLVIGAGITTFSPFVLYFYLAPLWVFLLGLFLVWFSGRAVKTKITWTLAPVIGYIAWQFIWYQWNKAPAETFLIPQSYRGKVHVRFNKPCGQVADIANGRRQYKVPG